MSEAAALTWGDVRRLRDGGADETEYTVHTPARHLHSNGLGRRWADRLAQFDVQVPHDTADRSGEGGVRKTVTPPRRKPTPLQTARWRAVRKAKHNGLYTRGIARELGIHKNTVRKNMDAESPPIARGRTKSTVS